MQRHGPTQNTSEKLFLCSETEKCHAHFCYDKCSEMVRRKTHLKEQLCSLPSHTHVPHWLHFTFHCLLEIYGNWLHEKNSYAAKLCSDVFSLFFIFKALWSQTTFLQNYIDGFEILTF
jgi:hypothetical protein